MKPQDDKALNKPGQQGADEARMRERVRDLQREKKERLWAERLSALVTRLTLP